MKIFSDKLNEADRLQLANVLVKAGFTVRIGRRKKEIKSGYKYFVEIKSNEDNKEVYCE